MLGEYYGKLLSNEVPDRFAKLLNELERAEPGKMEATETKAED